MTHTLKTWKQYFNEIYHGNKRWEVRKNDRNYKTGDTLILLEWDTEKEDYTGRSLKVKVTYKLDGGVFGIEEGYCVMSIRILN